MESTEILLVEVKLRLHPGASLLSSLPLPRGLQNSTTTAMAVAYAVQAMTEDDAASAVAEAVTEVKAEVLAAAAGKAADWKVTSLTRMAAMPSAVAMLAATVTASEKEARVLLPAVTPRVPKLANPL